MNHWRFFFGSVALSALSKPSWKPSVRRLQGGNPGVAELGEDWILPHRWAASSRHCVKSTARETFISGVSCKWGLLLPGIAGSGQWAAPSLLQPSWCLAPSCALACHNLQHQKSHLSSGAGRWWCQQVCVGIPLSQLCAGGIHLGAMSTCPMSHLWQQPGTGAARGDGPSSSSVYKLIFLLF